MIVASVLDRVPQALGAFIAHCIGWTPLGHQALVIIDSSGDERLIGKCVNGTIRAYGKLSSGPLLIHLTEPLDYHGHYNALALELLVLAPVSRRHGPARLLVTWAAVRLVDAPTFADQEDGRTLATGRLALTSCWRQWQEPIHSLLTCVFARVLTTRRATMADGDDTKEPKPPNPEAAKGDGDDFDARPADESAQAHEASASPTHDYERLYETPIGRLIATARDDFGIEEVPAIELANDVMMTFLHASSRVTNIPGWLTGAISFASEAYVLRGVVVGWARESAAPPDLTLPNGVLWRDVAGRLTPRFRRVMELRYVENRAVAEIAEILGTTQRYVETLLERCLKQTEKFSSRPEEP